jgi:hypothetical protein
MKSETIVMDEPALGVMGPAGDRTMVRRTTHGRFVVMSLAGRIIRVFTESWKARAYNAWIHGERL